MHSFNKFSSEFPDLRRDEQTKDELLSRVEVLSNTLWDLIEQRKDESLNSIKVQSEEGWSITEMKQVCRHMANLVEIEIKKFSCVYQILKEAEPPVELDAEILTKKLLERGTQPYIKQTKTSPVLQQIVMSLVSKLDELFTELKANQASGDETHMQILEQEKSIFMYRLAQINTWGLVLLEEISMYSDQVYQLMDDWVVEAVAQENYISQQIVQKITGFVKDEHMRIEDYECQLQKLSLFSRIQKMSFSNDMPPLYLQNVHVPQDDLESCRFGVDDLNFLYKEMRRNVGIRGSYDTLDSQSFISLMSLSFRHGKVPLVWKFMQFDKIAKLAQKFAEAPLPVLTSGIQSPTQYKSQLGKSMSKSFASKDDDPRGSWVNWKKVLTCFCLLNTQLPTEEQLNEYRAALEAAAEGGSLTLEAFQGVSTLPDF